MAPAVMAMALAAAGVVASGGTLAAVMAGALPGVPPRGTVRTTWLAGNALPLALIAGWGMAGDAFHIVRPDPAGHGMAAAVTAALRRASIGAEQVSYINAHGTGTRTNDVAETAALRRALGEHTRAIPISATKSTTGHSLEGCGAVETVIGLLALTSGSLPPTAELYDVDPACDLAHIRLRPIAARPQYVLNVNASVGGVNTAILLERA